MPDGENTLYRVVYVGQVGDAVRRMTSQAASRGESDKFLASLKGLVQRLQTAPSDFGEPCKDLQWLQLQVRLGVYRVLAAQFAVDDQRRIVYMLNLVPLAGHGLS